MASEKAVLQHSGAPRRRRRLLAPALQRGTHRSLRAAVKDALRERLVTLCLAPGKAIGLTDLQKEYGVALSAIREALCQLSVDGLVLVEEQRGFYAAPVSPDDLLDLCRARIEVETFVIRDAIANADMAWEARITGEFEKLARLREKDGENPRIIGAAYRQQHATFHDALASGCRSPRMKRFRRLLHEQGDRYRQLAVVYDGPGRTQLREHKELLEAALARDAVLAGELVAKHVNRTAEVLLRSMALTGAGEFLVAAG